MDNTIELTKINIEKHGIYIKEGIYYVSPKRPYQYFICKGCSKDFIRYQGKLLYCSNKCSNPIIRESNKLDFNIIRESFSSEGYELLSTESEYDNNEKKLDFICPNGHKHNISWANWSVGQRCGKCAKNVTVSLEEKIKLFNDNGYIVEIPTDKKISAFHSKFNYTCPNGHKHSVTYTSFKSGCRCPYCQNQIAIKFKDIKKSFEDEGYTVLTDECDYRSQNKTKIDFICPSGHRHNISVRKWRNGQRCGKCVVSKEERELRKVIDQFNVPYKMNDRTTLLNPKTNCYLELDIFFPKINKAIEYNGNYWHSRAGKINNDNIKKELCDEKGIALMIINDNDWYDNRTNTIQNLHSFIAN